MTDLCCALVDPPESSTNVGTCPGCGQWGRQVALMTVQAQVAFSLRKLAAAGYRFCATPGCTVVYYAAGAPPIVHSQLRERVFQKEAAGDVLVCYCFRHSVVALQQRDSARHAAILADIVAGTRRGQCACELRNPQGSCCLGNVRQLLRLSEVKLSGGRGSDA